MNFIELINYNTTNVRDIKYEVLCFMRTAENYFKLTPNMCERVEYLYKKTWSIKPNNFHNIRYENVVLGIVLFVIDEYYDSIDIDQTMNVNSMSIFVNELYKKSDVKSNIIQIYRVRDTIKELETNVMQTYL